MNPSSKPERLNAFSDGVFAIIITVLVLDLRAPDSASFAALLPLWRALRLPLWGLGLCCACLALYVRPEAPVVRVGSEAG